MPRADVVVIGAGLAGLTCAAELAERGARVFLAAKGMATTHWTHGGLDLAAPPGARTAADGIRQLAAEAGHPYARIGGDVAAALDGHRARLAARGLPLHGGSGSPLVSVPTALGGLRRVAIAPAAQAASLEPWDGSGLLLVGIERYRDAWAPYAARNLAAAEWPSGPSRIAAVEVALPGLERLRNLNARTLAVLFDDPAWRARAVAAIAAAVPAGDWRLGVPAVLGITDHAAAHAELEAGTGHRVVEIVSLPPSIPGLRLYDALHGAILAAGGRVQVGFDVVEVERSGRRVTAIHTEAAARTLRIAADEFVLATGGFGGEGFRARPDGTIDERVLGLPVTAPPREAWFSDDPFAPHPIESAGIATDDALRPLADGHPALADGHPALDNVRVVGSALAGMRYLAQRCGDGVALASAHRAARALAGEAVAA